MLKLTILFYFLSLSGNIWSQQITKVKIEYVNKYIQQSDHPLIINFWATWCKPCVQEMPTFQTLTSKYKDAKVELVLVSLDFPEAYPTAISKFADEKNI